MTQARPRRRLGLLWALAAFVLAAAAPAWAAPSFPSLTGRVVDEAGILPPQTKAALTAKLEALEARTKRQLVVATLRDLQGYEIEEYGYQLGRAWGIGRQGANDGVLFLVAPGQRKVRIEVGYGLEGVLTDALSSVILQTRVLPRFKDGDMAGGVVAGTDALIEQLSLDAPAASARIAQAEAQAASAADVQVNPQVMVFVIIVVLWLLMGVLRGRGRRRSSWWIPPVIMGGGGWGGRGGGWGGGGGGFGGGGGSFGGGGSSGSW